MHSITHRAAQRSRIARCTRYRKAMPLLVSESRGGRPHAHRSAGSGVTDGEHGPLKPQHPSPTERGGVRRYGAALTAGSLISDPGVAATWTVTLAVSKWRRLGDRRSTLAGPGAIGIELRVHPRVERQPVGAVIVVKELARWHRRSAEVRARNPESEMSESPRRETRDATRRAIDAADSIGLVPAGRAAITSFGESYSVLYGPERGQSNPNREEVSMRQT